MTKDNQPKTLAERGKFNYWPGLNIWCFAPSESERRRMLEVENSNRLKAGNTENAEISKETVA